ncbi:Calcium-activated potassium channel slo-1 [Schistosoma japonicum]|nr:Calcium-activated potassium channel slo-1 [Schistosoma japonicum]
MSITILKNYSCELQAIIVLSGCITIFFIGSLLIYLITLSRRRRKKGDVDEENLRKLLRFKNPLWLPKYAKITLSGKNYLGRFLILSRTLACLVCMTIYLWNSHRTERATCNTLNKQWMFGFLYFARLTRIPESLVLLRIINQERSIRIVNLIFKLLAAWTVIAGFVLVLESLGNFWVIGNTYRSLEYLDCLYMILVTLATVGYGDIVCTSYLGRIFIIFVIIGALITVTTHISELSELFQQHNQYHKGIYMEHIPRHIVVCGSINYSTLSTFYEEYVNADKGHYDENMMIVILSEIDPDIRLMALLQRESTTMRFLKGSVTLPEDLERAKVRTAEAVIILSNKCSQTPVEDDWKNLMCAWMSNIPGWKEYESDKFDRAICLPQMKLGLLALNCLASGISTLLCNFIMRDSVPTNSVRKTLPRWINEYFEGTKYKLYTVKFSHALDGMLFQQLVGLAMEFWGVLLLAVQVYTDNNKKTQMIINPGVRVRINTYRMRAVVLAKNLIEAQRLRTYTMDNQITFDNYGQVILSPLMRNTDSIYEKTKPFSTTGTNLVKMIGKCFNIFRQPFIIYNKIRGNKVIQKVSKHPSTFSMNSYHHHLHPDSTIVDFVLLKKLNSIDLQCDSTGLFYWVTERKFSNICLTMKEMIRCQFKNHIIVCITKQAKGIKLGLASFVLPLRSTSISIEELKPIIILCEAKVIENEWRSLKNLPNIYVFSGSPLNRANLRAAGVERCSTCVVLSSLYDNSGRPSLMVDKESILCTLNIRQLLADANKTNDISNASLLSTNSKCGSTYFNPLVASGNIFESNVLHSLSSTVLFDPTVITFIETILGGGPGHEVEKVFAIDSGFFPGLRGQPVSTLMFPDYLTGNIPSQEDDKNEYDRNVSNEVQNTLSTIEKTDINCREVDNEQINVKSFLSYKTATGESIAVRLSQLRLIPLLELDNELYQLSSQGLLTFSQLFHAVLVNTGTISIGLYRSVNASNKMDDDLSCKNMHHEVSGKIERFVYTLPEPITPIYSDDMVSMKI